MQNNPIRISCYVVGAGAFGVFVHWLQAQMAFNAEGLPERSVFHVFVPLFIVAVIIVFMRFVDAFRNNRFFLSEDFSEALSNNGKLYSIVRWAAGGLMILGGIILLATSETEKMVGFLRILALLAVLSGIAFPLWLSAANQPVRRPGLMCLLALAPIALFAFWIITCYKMNDTNSVRWAFGIELFTACVTTIAFFRIAGFSFGAPNSWRSMFYCMFGASMCIMSVADSRNFGMQLMLIAAAIMLGLCNWIMVKNLQQRQAQPRVKPDDGFERL